MSCNALQARRWLKLVVADEATYGVAPSAAPTIGVGAIQPHDFDYPTLPQEAISFDDSVRSTLTGPPVRAGRKGPIEFTLTLPHVMMHKSGGGARTRIVANGTDFSPAEPWKILLRSALGIGAVSASGAAETGAAPTQGRGIVSQYCTIDGSPTTSSGRVTGFDVDTGEGADLSEGQLAIAVDTGTGLQCAPITEISTDTVTVANGMVGGTVDDNAPIIACHTMTIPFSFDTSSGYGASFTIGALPNEAAANTYDIFTGCVVTGLRFVLDAAADNSFARWEFQVRARSWQRGVDMSTPFGTIEPWVDTAWALPAQQRFRLSNDSAVMADRIASSVTVDFGLQRAPVADIAGVAGEGCNPLVGMDPTIEVSGLWTAADVADFSAGTQRVLSFICGSMAGATPIFACHIPAAYLKQSPEAGNADGKRVVTLRFGAAPSGLSAANSTPGTIPPILFAVA